MSIWKRLFSADFRAAVSAEAAGQLDQAAEHYVLAGEHLEAARVHLARAERAQSRAAEIDALRDALHWAGEDPDLGAHIRRALGRALLARTRAEGVATDRDRKRVREAAELLTAGGDHQRAGEALESIGDIQEAAHAYGKGGLLDRMEAVLARDDGRQQRERTVREAFANYEVHMRIGEREAARAELRRCIEAADNKAEYRRLLDALESRLITGGQVELRPRNGSSITAVGGPTITLGRDPLCELPLRAGGVSRRHAEIAVMPPGQGSRFHLRDLGSRNGTRIAGLAIATAAQGSVPLSGTGSFSLGDDCRIEYEVGGEPPALPYLVLRVTSGVDRGQLLLAAGVDEPLDLRATTDLPVCLRFRDGRPLLSKSSDTVKLLLNGAPLAHGPVQLIHGDELMIDGAEVDIV